MLFRSHHVPTLVVCHHTRCGADVGASSLSHGWASVPWSPRPSGGCVDWGWPVDHWHFVPASRLGVGDLVHAQVLRGSYRDLHQYLCLPCPLQPPREKPHGATEGAWQLQRRSRSQHPTRCDGGSWTWTPRLPLLTAAAARREPAPAPPFFPEARYQRGWLQLLTTGSGGPPLTSATGWSRMCMSMAHE